MQQKTKSGNNEERITEIITRIESLELETRRLKHEVELLVIDQIQTESEFEHRTTVSAPTIESARRRPRLSSIQVLPSSVPEINRTSNSRHSEGSRTRYHHGNRIIEIDDIVIITNDYRNKKGTIGRVTNVTDKRVTLIDQDNEFHTRALHNVQVYENPWRL